MSDFAHSDEAVRNRQAKATTLADYLTLLGFTRGEVAAFGDPDRRQIEREAGVNRCSEKLTWALTLTLLPDPPPAASASIDDDPPARLEPAPSDPDDPLTPPEGMACRHFYGDRFCASTTDVHPYTSGRRCQAHKPLPLP